MLTEAFQQRVDAGWYPVYPEKSQGGLTVRDRAGRVLHRSPNPARVYADFDSIPALIWKALVYIENRTFLDEDRVREFDFCELDRVVWWMDGIAGFRCKRPPDVADESPTDVADADTPSVAR